MTNAIEPNLLGRVGVDVLSAYFDEPFSATASPVAGCSSAGIEMTEGTRVSRLGVSCDERLTREMAVRLHLIDQGAPAAQDDLDETVRELCNVLAGNLKAELGNNATLSVPKTHQVDGGVSVRLASLAGALEITYA